ncbi:hypothetical protein IG631_04549 [Alternaria alternata]|nr:hypothetical protein IG631_04549 [Alternaria alternata]
MGVVYIHDHHSHSALRWPFTAKGAQPTYQAWPVIPKYCLLYTIIFYRDTVSMQQKQRSALSPLPDITRNPSAPLRPAHHPFPPIPAPEFLIIGVFALRLTERLILSLDYYPGRDADIIWLVNFLAPYPNDYKLAKISGSRRDDYLAMYQNIVSRMKKQPKYPVRFIQMNPDPSMQQARRGREMDRPMEMTDGRQNGVTITWRS